MKFESLNDPMFRILSETKSRALRGGYTTALTSCTQTTNNDHFCGDRAEVDKDKPVLSISA